MTMAICMNWGYKKEGPLEFCQNCGFQPRKNTDQTLSKILSEHIHQADELKEISAEIKRGRIFKYPEDFSGGYLKGFKKPRKGEYNTEASSFDFSLLFLFLLTPSCYRPYLVYFDCNFLR